MLLKESKETRSKIHVMKLGAYLDMRQEMENKIHVVMKVKNRNAVLRLGMIS